MVTTTAVQPFTHILPNVRSGFRTFVYISKVIQLQKNTESRHSKSQETEQHYIIYNELKNNATAEKMWFEQVWQ